MRAATAIVGAIAASSILIALAFILPGGGNSGVEAVTRTVTEGVEATKSNPESEEPARAQEPSVAPVGGLTECNGGEYNVEDVSCEVGEEIHRQYKEGARGGLIAEDKEAGETITMTCE